MFGPINPKVKDLQQFANTWSKDQTIGATLPAASNQNRISPALIWQGNGFSNSTTSIPLRYKAFAQPFAQAPAYADWKLQYSVNNAAYTDAIVYQPNGLTTNKALLNVTGAGRFTLDNSSTVDTLLTFEVRTTGSKNHIGMTNSGTTRAAWSSDNTGSSEFRVAGSTPTHTFYTGGSIGSQTLIAQIFNNGFYNSYSNFNNGKVTAGSADQTVQTTLSTYGSFAAKGVLVTSANYTLADSETFVYVDASQGAFCVGTPTACNTYMTEGNCNAHTGVGCSWFAGNACSVYNGDTGACLGQAGCSLVTASCSSADNTDQTTCEALDDAYGGTCSWDTSTCPAYTTIATCDAETGCTSDITGDCTTGSGGSQAACEALGDGTTCSWVGGDCHAFDSTDQSTCESGHTGCTWDSGGNLCNGVYDEASVCSGNYFVGCTGNLCNSTYNTGDCSGTYGAACQGTASCSNLTDDGSVACAAESGCAWQTGINVTLPTTANASRGTTGRVYSIMNVGDTGTVSISGQTGQPIFQYTTLSLFKKGDKVLLHNQNITFQCSIFTSSTPCNAQSGCTWQATVVCSSLGDESSCNAQSGCGCSWDGSSCSGSGCTAGCNGTYTNGSHWYAHSLERGLNYVEKTANYTITDIDDIVNCTANSFTLTLPSASLNNGKQYSLKNTGSGTITLNTTSGQTIDGNASGTLTLTPADSLTVMSNNSNWIII